MMIEAEKYLLEKNSKHRVKDVEDLKELFRADYDFFKKQKRLDKHIEDTMKFFNHKNVDSEISKAFKNTMKEI